MDHFKVSRLPVVIVRGVPVLDGIKEKIDECVNERKRATHERIKGIVDPCLVTVFIKEYPTRPRCGFTRNLIEILHDAGLSDNEIKHFDILSDEDIRRGMKEVNNWPTFPQVYIKGEFVGGLDVIRKMNEKGKLKEKLQGII